ncbi:glycosyltransferase family 4 protein [Arenibaculum pallidiluteum]|uniref:glycosyltransferase family 4 protein n=1 Tax=Arenibaculum pallidiluteum TaxID=2812559 RepID=UPI001A967FA9|nr:glycosyltransferase family 4 protein [Arenibaculum pallidiluteum]
MNLLVWCWGRRGGSVRLTHDLVKSLRARDDVDLSVSLSRQSELFYETSELGLPGFHVDTYTGIGSALVNSLRLPILRARMARLVRERNIHVVLCVMRHPWSSVVFPAFREAGARVLMELHDAEPHPGESYPFWQQHLAMDLAATDGLVVLSEHVRRAALATHNYPADRIWTVPHAGFVFDPPARRESPRSLPTDRPPRLLFFGRLLEYKGLDLLAKAYRLLRGRREVELRIVGTGRSALVGGLHGKPGVTLDLRWIPEREIGPILNEADLIVAPYREASQSGVIPAAYSLGLPVVAMPVGGLVEQVEHGRTGLIAGQTNAESFAATVEMLLDNPGLYRTCSEGALNASRTTLDADRVAGRLCDIARQVAAIPPR